MATPDRDPHGLLRHLDGLYHVAGLLTRSPRAAAELVEAAARRAGEEPPSDRPRERTELLRLLLRVHAERHGEGHETARPLLQAGLYRRLARHYLHRALPSAFAALPPEQQLLLLLTAVERLPLAEAGQVLGLSPEAARERRDDAHGMLRAALYRRADEAERELMRDHATADDVADALRHLLRSERATAPPRLREAVQHLVGPEDARPAAQAAPAPTREAGDERSTRFHRALIGVMLVVVAGLAGWLATELTDRPAVEVPAAQDVLLRSAARANAVQPALETGDTGRAAAFALEATGLRVDVPAIRGTALAGVGTDQVAPDVEVPVFLYRGTDGASGVALFTYSYALLDRNAAHLALSPEVRRRIAEEGRYGTRTLDDRQVLVWRRRDDIYVAVTADSADRLRLRLRWEDDG